MMRAAFLEVKRRLRNLLLTGLEGRASIATSGHRAPTGAATLNSPTPVFPLVEQVFGEMEAEAIRDMHDTGAFSGRSRVRTLNGSRLGARVIRNRFRNYLRMEWETADRVVSRKQALILAGALPKSPYAHLLPSERRSLQSCLTVSS